MIDPTAADLAIRWALERELVSPDEVPVFGMVVALTDDELDRLREGLQQATAAVRQLYGAADLVAGLAHELGLPTTAVEQLLQDVKGDR